jgi:hypothetical protein
VGAKWDGQLSRRLPYLNHRIQVARVFWQIPVPVSRRERACLTFVCACPFCTNPASARWPQLCRLSFRGFAAITSHTRRHSPASAPTPSHHANDTHTREETFNLNLNLKN